MPPYHRSDTQRSSHAVGRCVTHNILGAAIQKGRKTNELGPDFNESDTLAPLTSRGRGPRSEVPPDRVWPLIQIANRHSGPEALFWLHGIHSQITHDGTGCGAVNPAHRVAPGAPKSSDTRR